jgi:hypothetical protein
MVKRRNSPYASHDPAAPTRVPIDCTPQTLPAMPKSEAKPNARTKKAWSPRNPNGGCGNDFQDALKGYGMKSSMSRKGNCWDNAPTESLWGRLKVGRLYGKTFATQRDAMDEIIDRLTFYNHRRLHSSLDYVSPVEFEKAWHAAQQDKAA